MQLTSKQKKYLKGQAHHLNPIVQIGKNGLNNEIKTNIRQALDARELIKIVLLQNTDEAIDEVAEILEVQLGLTVIQKIGKIIVAYKKSDKKENRKITNELYQIK
ncbi:MULTISPECIES: ribosome assembly RNA-binding protein YhbY [unclassified Enterococcus]|uniref:ribosome assembly RNA-binding protein YhbY n=1 Tax=unclassified Enterococcus TaxID=2608891 RepID=UPI001553BEF8|nr:MULTISPECIES: ribosome assembly RNA-binding protein YhbY [unclassified Enterococcus]MBS7576700.1 ribosome assembly RNA-binding protein YhbY [Enterococcus sp. MMGLQ5-2]MBS7583813.1 ribosome assembly RNA-binding protein YhbY [Enterococcus sp. MMGLQ5-1]NPD11674.1 ribosome assembly RNA-binding protein YhbY [Enterococcus sp. MMGLQ5-1]NPD36537.1 ribosome assembly RNA-binding protein YhbY [Enterococcus sp. MMGLQ5-2]